MVTIKNAYLTVEISPKGAELQSVKGTDGHEYIWQADPKFWASHAPIMFPVCGGLKEDAYYLDGKRYPMTKHGFAKLCDWKVAGTKENEAVFELTEKHEGFPFDYVFRCTYTLKERSLVIAYTVENRGNVPFFYGIGSHEAYATPGGLEGCTIETGSHDGENEGASSEDGLFCSGCTGVPETEKSFCHACEPERFP